MDYKNIYIIGIGGCASSAIGEFLNNQGLIVSGSDMSEKKELHDLIKKGITVHFGHKKENLYTNGKPDIVLYTPAIIALNPNNPELLEAKAQGIKTESWEDILLKMKEEKEQKDDNTVPLEEKEYEVNLPAVPESIRMAKELERKEGRSLYE